jgi:hypothetical protein
MTFSGIHGFPGPLEPDGERRSDRLLAGVGTLHRSPGETERRVLEAEVVGLYDPRAKSLFVRGSTSGSAGRWRRGPFLVIMVT